MTAFQGILNLRFVFLSGTHHSLVKGPQRLSLSLCKVNDPRAHSILGTLAQVCAWVSICAEICGLCPKVQQFEFLEDTGIRKETCETRNHKSYKQRGRGSCSLDAPLDQRKDAVLLLHRSWFLAFPLKRDSPPQETLDPSAKLGQFSVVHSMENLGPMRLSLIHI